MPRTRSMARPASALIVALGLATASVAHAARLVVFGLDPRGVEPRAAQAGTDALLRTLRAAPGVNVVDPETGRARLGVDLTVQARACDYDVFCLVEIGELLQGEKVLIGHLSRPPPTDARADDGLELKLMVIDVAKASTTEVLVWRVPDLDPDALEDAMAAAGRRLFAPTDARVRFVLDPPSTRLRLYGEPLAVPAGGGPLDYWSGVYHVLARAKGYQPLQVRVRLPRGRGVTEVPLALEPDPLYVGASSPPVRVFDKDSRRLGSGATHQTAGAKVAPPPAPSRAFEGPLPWITAGVGLGLTVAGAVLMNNAQSGYNELAAQRRYTPGTTVTADLAARDRDRHRTGYRAGSATVVGGVAVLVGAAAWMLVDLALAADAEEANP